MILGLDATRANKRQKTGVEWYSYHLIQHLKEIIPSEVTVRLYSRKTLRGELGKLPQNWESKVLRWPPRFLWTIVRLSWEMWKYPPNLLFVPAHTIPLVLPVKTVTTIHDIGFDRFPELYSKRQLWYHRLNIKRVFKHCLKVITISEWTKKELIDVYGDVGDKLFVIPLAYDANFYNHRVSAEEQKQSQAKYGVSRPYFIFLGRLERKKNINNIVKAFGEFKKQDNKGHTLVLVGRRGYGSEEVDAGRGEEVWSNVEQLPWVSEKDKLGLLAGAEALVFPSRYEGFGLPVLEAMAVGTPVITSNHGATAEVAGEAGHLVDVNDVNDIAKAMVNIARDESWRLKLKEAGLKRVANFSWDRTAKETWQVLQDLLR